MKVRNAKERAVLFGPLVPGVTTVAAINEARGGGPTGFANSKALLKWVQGEEKNKSSLTPGFRTRKDEPFDGMHPAWYTRDRGDPVNRRAKFPGASKFQAD